MESEIVDELGTPMPDGEIGELIVKSNLVMNGYFNRQEENEKALRNGALYTGDVGYRDSDGFYYIVDRNKDLIISGGFNIYPSDLEAELEQHPDVAEAAVIGVPSRAWGETPVGYVVLRPAATIDRDALLAWVNARLGKTQRLSDLILIANLPRNEIGKTLKRELREQYLRA